MLSRRRLALQMTPLLDMLLIIVFAQYLDMREREQFSLAENQAAVVELESTRERLKSLVLEEQHLRHQIEMDRRQLATSQLQLEKTQDQNLAIGELVTELFRIPPGELDELLTAARVPALERSPQEAARVREQFRQISQMSRGQMIEHLLSYDELRKRCDIWELHIDDKGFATISFGQKSTRLRIPTLINDDVNVDALVDNLYSWYRALPQPKNLVVLLLTCERGTRISVMDAVRKALPILMQRMQADHFGQIRFEYADLGFRLH